MEAGCKRADVEVFGSRALEAGCRCRRGGVWLKSSGGVLQVYGRGGGTEIWSYGALDILLEF